MDKLTAATQSLNGGRANAACNQLTAFVNQVNALIDAGKLREVAAIPEPADPPWFAVLQR